MNAGAVYAGSAATQITADVPLQCAPLLAEQMGIAFFQVAEEQLLRHIGEAPMVHQVLHRLVALTVEGVKDTVLHPVELQRRHIKQLAQTLVERRRSLDPTPLQVQLGVAVHGEHITAQQLQQTRGRQVIAHVRQTDARGNPAMPGTTGQQRGLGHTVAFAGNQGMTAPQGLRIRAEGIEVVTHGLTHRVIKVHRLLPRIAAGTAMRFGELHHRRVVTIDEAAGTQVLVHGQNLQAKPGVYRDVRPGDNDVSAKDQGRPEHHPPFFNAPAGRQSQPLHPHRHDHPLCRRPTKL